MPSDLMLLTGSGAKVACGCEGRSSSTIVQRLGVGSYFAIVRGRPGASGRYVISLRLRRTTSVALRVTGPKGTPRAARTAAATVSPKAGGRVVFEIEQFDPLSGWHFERAIKRTAAEGRARIVIAPTQGRWRIRARYTGSLASSPSTSVWVQIVAG